MLHVFQSKKWMDFIYIFMYIFMYICIHIFMFISTTNNTRYWRYGIMNMGNAAEDTTTLVTLVYPCCWALKAPRRVEAMTGCHFMFSPKKSLDLSNRSQWMMKGMFSLLPPFHHLNTYINTVWKMPQIGLFPNILSKSKYFVGFPRSYLASFRRLVWRNSNGKTTAGTKSQSLLPPSFAGDCYWLRPSHSISEPNLIQDRRRSPTTTVREALLVIPERSQYIRVNIDLTHTLWCFPLRSILRLRVMAYPQRFQTGSRTESQYITLLWEGWTNKFSIPWVFNW